MIKKNVRDEIVSQALSEIIHARQYKQRRTWSWFRNENMYYGLKNRTMDKYGNIVFAQQSAADARANVELGKMQSFVHTLLSKIDNPLIFKFKKRKNSDYKRALRANALREIDADEDNWDMKDLLGKKQAVIYGRAIYSYHAESIDGYKSILENVDVYDFLIDPSAGGIDIERAWYMGRYGIIKSKEDLKNSDLYIKTEVQKLIDGAGNSGELTQEETNKRNRELSTNGLGTTKEINNSDKYKFWEWYTTYKGERYYLLMTEDGCAIRVEKLKDIFESGLYPFWTWAAFPDLTEFWTPSYCDYVREIFQAQSVSINQLLDNSEQVNKPQKAVDVSGVEDINELKYRKDGIIRVKAGVDVNKAVQLLQVPSIDTPIKTYELLEAINEKESGVTGASKGIAEEERVAIYEGNQQATADRYGLLNKSYSFGYKRFARLWYEGVKEHLRKKVAVDILGPDGVEVEEITKKDVIPPKGGFKVSVESSDAESMMSSIKAKNKIAFLNGQVNNPLVNQKKLLEMAAETAGISPDEIKSLMEQQFFGTMDMLAEADRDLEDILAGTMPKPNMNANFAYVQRMVDYAKNQREFLSDEQFNMIFAYIDTVQPFVQQNAATSVVDQQVQMAQGGGAPVDPNQINTNPIIQQ